MPGVELSKVMRPHVVRDGGLGGVGCVSPLPGPRYQTDLSLLSGRVYKSLPICKRDSERMGASRWQSEPKSWVSRFLTPREVHLTGYACGGMTHHHSPATLTEEDPKPTGPSHWEWERRQSLRLRKDVNADPLCPCLKQMTKASLHSVPCRDPNFRPDSKGVIFP